MVDPRLQVCQVTRDLMVQFPQAYQMFGPNDAGGRFRTGRNRHTAPALFNSGEFYGVPQRKGRARDTVFRGSLRGAGLAEPMGSADRVTPH
jgi:hypothetical protein